MTIRYRLHGTFVEACNCQVICPCWVDDQPDEDHCAGLFAWTFDPGSVIEGYDVGGLSVVSVSVHGNAGRRGGGSQSAIYVDDAAGPDVAAVLIRAFAGEGGSGDPLASLASVTGDVIEAGRAEVSMSAEADGWLVEVGLAGTSLVHARTSAARFDSRPGALTLSDTALSAELGQTAEDKVTAHRATELSLDVAALPGPPVFVRGRSAMSGRFRYQVDDDDD